MDLSLIRQRIMSGALLSLDDMSRDLFVMCNNAMVFNGKGDPYFDYSKVFYICRPYTLSPVVFRVPTMCVRQHTKNLVDARPSAITKHLAGLY